MDRKDLDRQTRESGMPLQSFTVCSDTELVKKPDKSDEDIVEPFTHEQRYPATIDARRLAINVTAGDAHAMI